jgi:hypothetical protein
MSGAKRPLTLMPSRHVKGILYAFINSKTVKRETTSKYVVKLTPMTDSIM